MRSHGGARRRARAARGSDRVDWAAGLTEKAPYDTYRADVHSIYNAKLGVLLRHACSAAPPPLPLPAAARITIFEVIRSADETRHTRVLSGNKDNYN